MREKDFLPLLGGVARDSGGRVSFHLESVLVVSSKYFVMIAKRVTL